MAYIEILDSELDSESESRDGTPSLLKKLRDNPIEIAAGPSGAPPFENAAFQDNEIDFVKVPITSIPANKIQANTITEAKFGSTLKQNHLKTELFTATFQVDKTIVNPAGLYMLGWKNYWIAPQVPASGDTYMISFGGGSLEIPGFPDDPPLSNLGPIGIAFIDLDYKTASSFPLAGIDVRFFSASPPYNLGNGDIPLFIFCKVDSNGAILGTWVSPDPPWAYNGPTIITPQFKRNGKSYRFRRKVPFTRQQALTDPEKMEAYLDAFGDPKAIEEYEITQTIKNADMDLIPHGWATKRQDESIVLIDPVGEFTERLKLMREDNDDFPAMLSRGYVKLDNSPISGAIAPPGVMPVRAWIE